MDWIKRRLKDRADFEKRTSALQSGTRTLGEELYRICAEAVLKYNVEAQKNGLPKVQSKARLRDSFGFVSTDYENGVEKEKAAVTVSQDAERYAFYLGLNPNTKTTMPIFTVDLDENGAPVLKHEGRTIDFEQAAERILDPVLFWDLPQVFPVSGKG